LTVKLDRSFIAAITEDRRAAAIVRTVIDLAETLGLTAVAEGVENAETATALASYGCTVAQGYFCGRPLPITELLEYLSERSGADSFPVTTTCVEPKDVETSRSS
jgi:diguanylate cyclase